MTDNQKTYIAIVAFAIFWLCIGFGIRGCIEHESGPIPIPVVVTIRDAIPDPAAIPEIAKALETLIEQRESIGSLASFRAGAIQIFVPYFGNEDWNDFFRKYRERLESVNTVDEGFEQLKSIVKELKK